MIFNSKLSYGVAIEHICLGVILLFGLFGCQAPVIKVEQISPKKVGKTVYLTGKIARQAPFLDNAAYQLEDGTGKVWVVTTKELPTSKQQINIKGTIQYQSLPFADRELGDFYLVEIERLPSLPE